MTGPFPFEVVQRTFGVEPAISPAMRDAVKGWNALYVNDPPWKSRRVFPVGLPAAICREISRPVFAEFRANFTGDARADFLQETFREAQGGFTRALELGLALGNVIFKPYLRGDKILLGTASLDTFAPTKFDPAGVCVGGVFKGDPVRVGDQWYVLMEYHDLTDDTYTIHNRAFHSDQRGMPGDGAPLSVVPEWADIQPDVSVSPVSGPLFSCFKPPLWNTVDGGNLGVSIFGGATVDLIRQADEQWSQLIWEFRSGERKIFMDSVNMDAAQFDRDLFEIGLFTSGGDFFHEFSPAFRNDAIYQGLQAILRQIEFQVGLYAGAISDPQTVDRSATEVRSSKQRMFVTVDSIQKALGHTFDRLLYAMDVYATLYQLAPSGSYAVSYDWGDSVLTDPEDTERERANDRLDVQMKVMSLAEYRAKWYGELPDVAKKRLRAASSDTIPERW